VDETVSVEVGEDHVAAFRRSPKIAIAELIWNSLDADATEITVDYELNPLGGINAMVIRDDGTGMTPADATFGFRNFGNSWKRTDRENQQPDAGRFGNGAHRSAVTPGVTSYPCADGGRSGGPAA